MALWLLLCPPSATLGRVVALEPSLPPLLVCLRAGEAGEWQQGGVPVAPPG